ncbi:hypothetical protein AURDEDRAFT_170816 [Auricularia subglabra TFB-10046 SS5]|nr:hypothetical protein AURDEDRAFT_170816 [Auricularia subglabra TFB-10046 SS5]
MSAPRPASFIRRSKPKEPVNVELYFKGDASQVRTLRVWISRTVGSGAFGVILQAEMVSPVDPARHEVVAVKRFNPDAMDEGYQFFTREMERWVGLDHPRILPFYGDCDLGTGQVGLVSPLCRKGNMKQFITNNPRANRLTLACLVFWRL